MTTPDPQARVRGLTVHVNLEPRDGGFLPGTSEIDDVVQYLRGVLLAAPGGDLSLPWAVADIHQEGSVTADLPARVPVVQPLPIGEPYVPVRPEPYRPVEVLTRLRGQEDATVAASGEYGPELAEQVQDALRQLSRTTSGLIEVTVRRVVPVRSTPGTSAPEA